MNRKNKKNKGLIFVPVNAEKGDCFCCFDGVLVRNKDVEKRYKVKEGYTCSVCERNFVEGIFVKDYIEYLFGPNFKIPTRYFVEIDSNFENYHSNMGRRIRNI